MITYFLENSHQLFFFFLSLLFFILYLKEVRAHRATTTRALIEQTRLEERQDANHALAQKLETFTEKTLQKTQNSLLELSHLKMREWQESAKKEFALSHQQVLHSLSPLKDSLQKVHQELEALEKSRVSSSATLMEQLRHISTHHATLCQETQNLTNALKKPHVRGQWGELQLKRVVEIAGMLEYCDFLEQASAPDATQRPDMLIHLPNGKQVIIDAKTPLVAYLESLEASDEKKKLEKLAQHAKHVRSHVQKLSSKQYWKQFPTAPDFVLLFLPGESFFSAALEQDPSLVEFGANSQVILATPTTLIALLKTIAYGWKQKSLDQNTEKINQLGLELYERIRTLTQHFQDVHKHLQKAQESYNRAAKSLESRVLVTCRKFEPLEAASKPFIEPLETFCLSAEEKTETL